MFSVLVLCAGLTTASPSTEGPSPEDLAAYQAAQADLGRDADAHVKLALWCEAHGLKTEGIKHLAIAVVTNPKHATARGLLGLVAHRGRWQPPDVVIDKLRDDAARSNIMAEYNARRDRMPKTADGHWDLALWCEAKGLKAEATAHLATVVRFNPAREAAWKRLGCRRVGGRWVTEEQLAAERKEAEAQKQANKHWQPLLTKWRGWLRKEDRRAEAEHALAEITDPLAVPAVWAVFAGEGTKDQLLAVQVFGQIDASASARALALLVVRTKSSAVRQAACETLRRRDPREYVGFFLALLRDPLGYRTGLFFGEDGLLHRSLYVQGKQADTLATFEGPVTGPGIPYRAVPSMRLFTGDVPYDPLYAQYSMMFNGPFLNQATTETLRAMVDNPKNAAQVLAQPRGAGSAGSQGRVLPSTATAADILVRNATAAAQARDLWIHTRASIPWDSMSFQEEVGKLERARVAETETAVRETNSTIFAALNMITGQTLPEDREPWKKWWYDVQGYNYTPPKETKKVKPVRLILSIPSCFGAGTLVKAMDGPRPIETIRVGDQVLAQDAKNGALAFRAVTAIHHNPPGETLNVAIGGEVIVPSVFHRFWKVGQGWVMARELKPGDQLRMLDGPATVESVQPGGLQPVFNLDVAEDHDFFVGHRGALVHDNTLPELRLTPFDAEPDLTALTR